MSTVPVTVTVATLLTLAPREDARPAEFGDPAEVRALVDAARAGDREAFGALVDLHGHTVVRTARAALGSHDGADDVAQDAFIVAWQKLPGFRGDSSFKTWLLTIVWRKALDSRRRRQRWWTRATVAGTNDGLDPFDRLVAPAADPERVVVSRDEARRIAAAIAALSPKLRDTLLLAASGDHSYEEIAGILGVPIGTVKWRVSEARRIVAAQVPDRTRR
jgi:RNA polymerase sigma-70 factor, ECF subfamily